MTPETFDAAKVDTMIDKYGNDPSSLILVMQDIQSEYRFLPHEALAYLGEQLDVPMSRIYNVATFYKTFSLQPKGKHLVHVCMGTACHVRGAKRILDELSRALDTKPGDTTPDGEITLETVNCVGACALGPIMVVDGKAHGVTVSSAKEILADCKHD
jgi:NADH-quinone oxidoreductase subunit E